MPLRKKFFFSLWSTRWMSLLSRRCPPSGFSSAHPFCGLSFSYSGSFLQYLQVRVSGDGFFSSRQWKTAFSPVMVWKVPIYVPFPVALALRTSVKVAVPILSLWGVLPTSFFHFSLQIPFKFPSNSCFFSLFPFNFLNYLSVFSAYYRFPTTPFVALNSRCSVFCIRLDW